MGIEEDVTLILTAAVRVNPGVPGVTAPDPAAREEEYAENLRYHLREHPRVRRIVLAESSGWPLARFEDEAADNPLGKEVEILQLACNDFPGHLGKGYGEALLLDRALSASRFETRYLAKLTGRQRLANLTGLLEKLPADFAVCVDLRDHGLYERFGYPGAGRYCDTRFFVASRPFFDARLRQVYGELPAAGEFNLEDAYYRAVKAVDGEPGVICRFPVEPRYRGRAGHWHKDYGSARERVKQSLRAVARRLLPGFRF
jgi:hypothetical protein